MELLRLFIALLSIWGVSSSGVTIGITPYSLPIYSQYHAQDILGQYAYGYATPTSTKSETKSADGVTVGGYSYLDSFGILQTVRYFADPIHGFRVAATNLPQDLPDVALAKAQHLAEFQATQSERAAIAAHYTNPIVVPVSQVKKIELLPTPVQDLPEVVKARAEHLAKFQATQAEHAALAAHSATPVPVQDLPEVARAKAEHLATFEAIKARDASQVVVSPLPAHISAPVVAPAAIPYYSYVPAIPLLPSSQYHAQDGIGQYSYGYVGPLSSKSEAKTADGITRGGYSYLDARGEIQTVSYISDPVNGFRVAATNLPVAPEVLLKGPSASAKIVAPVAPTI
uniref:Cuticle protein 6 n=1 Tax=Photinus pyralis TaxID=7054 RepID=A0A1Y1K550_PHOPY